METAYIGIGSNVGDRVRYLSAGVDAIGRLGEVIAISHVYETEPHDVPSPQDRYLNMVVALQTERSPSDLLDSLLAIELDLGRVRFARNAPRTLDLDILFYGSFILDLPGLVVPHPRVHERAFALVPLAEIAPDLWHPTLSRPVNDLCAEVSSSGVRRLGTLAQLMHCAEAASIA